MYNESRLACLGVFPVHPYSFRQRDSRKFCNHHRSEAELALDTFCYHLRWKLIVDRCVGCDSQTLPSKIICRPKVYCGGMDALTASGNMLSGWLVIKIVRLCTTISLKPDCKVPALWPRRWRRRQPSFTVTLSQHVCNRHLPHSLRGSHQLEGERLACSLKSDSMGYWVRFDFAPKILELLPRHVSRSSRRGLPYKTQSKSIVVKRDTHNPIFGASSIIGAFTARLDRKCFQPWGVACIADGKSSWLAEESLERK